MAIENCAVVDGGGNVVNIIIADPSIDTVTDHTLVAATGIQIGATYSGGVFTNPVITAPSSESAVAVMNTQASVALAKADDTMLRIQEAVSLGATTWTTADVVAWVNYRRSLRPLVSATTAQTLPTQPAYPANT